MKQEALKALIEDLRLNHEYCPKEIILQAADELERLAQPQQEPCDMGEMCLGCSPRRADGSCPDAKPWVGLTDEEMTHTNHHMVEGAYQYSFKQGAKWAEAKLKEKNT